MVDDISLDAPLRIADSDQDADVIGMDVGVVRSAVVDGKWLNQE